MLTCRRQVQVRRSNYNGLLYHRRGLTQEAIEEFRRAIAINADYVKARSNLAVVLLEASRLAEARAELRAAMTVEPRSAEVIVNLALVEHADRHRDEAIELLLRAIEYQPTHAMAHYNVAVLYEEQRALVLAYDHYTEFLNKRETRAGRAVVSRATTPADSQAQAGECAVVDRSGSHFAVFIGALSRELELLRLALCGQRTLFLHTLSLALLRSELRPPLRVLHVPRLPVNFPLVQNEVAPSWAGVPAAEAGAIAKRPNAEAAVGRAIRGASGSRSSPSATMLVAEMSRPRGRMKWWTKRAVGSAGPGRSSEHGGQLPSCSSRELAIVSSPCSVVDQILKMQ